MDSARPWCTSSRNNVPASGILVPRARRYPRSTSGTLSRPPWEPSPEPQEPVEPQCHPHRHKRGEGRRRRSPARACMRTSSYFEAYENA
jgi:hypothetical protein